MLLTWYRRLNAAWAICVLLAVPAGADQIRKWRDANGKVHYSIVGDAKSRRPARDLGQPSSSEERFSVEASLRRKAIEQSLRKRAAELTEIRAALTETEHREIVVSSPGVPAKAVDPREVRALLDTQRNAFLTAKAFQEKKDRELRVLRRQQREKLVELGALWDDFEDLRAEIEEFYGGLPAWWRDRLDCRTCPAPDEIEQALLPAEDADDGTDREAAAAAEEPAEEEPGGASDAQRASQERPPAAP